MKNKRVIQLSAWLPVFLWALLIFRFSAGSVPVASPVYWQDFAVKKTGHMLLFGALALLFYRALRMNKVDKVKAAIWAVVLSTLYGASDELHQTFTQGREARVRDIFIDGLGASVVSLALYYLPTKMGKKFEDLLKDFGIN